MIKILFLDDEEWRHEKLRRCIKEEKLLCDVTHVYSYEKCVEALNKSYDLVCLDRDLADFKSYSHYLIEKSGNDVVNWIINNKKPEDFRVIVHSWNVPEGDNMAKDLTRYGFKTLRMPFGEEFLAVFSSTVRLLSKGS